MVKISHTYNTKNQEKWANHYWKLINRALYRELPKNEYVEKHHMFPKCLFGNNPFVVALTPEEHYLAHQLLVKMYPEHKKLVHACNVLGSAGGGVKIYGWLRRLRSKAMSELHKGRTSPNKGISMSQEQKSKISNTKKGICTLSKEQIEPPRFSRRLQLMRKWSYDQENQHQLFTGSP
ncbi:hypothetical protein [Methylobacter sp. sgz302048]|uniref:hypothetical protein n=1 Tax=Methylobacter sp. sgz302048 TaxID=3455945 RepID=UPI003F9F6129